MAYLRLKSVPTFAAMVYLLFPAHVARALPSNDACDLPKDLQSVVDAKYRGAKIVTQSDLREDDRQLFQKGHADGCPGLVTADFYGDGKPTFAVALTAKTESNSSTRLVLAHRVEKTWEITSLDKADGPIPVIWSEKPGEYKSVYGKKIRATKPVIIFCRYSSWAVLYSWTGSKVAKIWLQD